MISELKSLIFTAICLQGYWAVYFWKLSFSNRDTDWGQAAFSNLVCFCKCCVIMGHHTGLAKKEERGKLEEQEQSKSPASDALQSLTGHWTGSGGALPHVQSWAESFREQTGTRHCGPLPSTLRRKWSMAELLIARCKSCWKWIMCISLKTLVWFTL